MQSDFSEQVYDTLHGHYSLGSGVPGVENAFAPGAPCQILYADAFEAYQRICDRLGVIDEDDDLEIILNSLLSISRITGLRMFYYGAYFENRSENH